MPDRTIVAEKMLRIWKQVCEYELLVSKGLLKVYGSCTDNETKITLYLVELITVNILVILFGDAAWLDGHFH